MMMTWMMDIKQSNIKISRIKDQILNLFTNKTSTGKTNFEVRILPGTMKDCGGCSLFHILGLVLIIGTQSFSSLSFTTRSTNSCSTTGLCATLSREKRISGLSQWGNENDVKTGGIAIQSIQDSGLGLVAQQQVPSNSLVLTVPTKATLSVTTPGGPDDSSVVSMCSDRQSFRSLPWFCQFSLYMYKLNKISSVKELENLDLQPWLSSLPKSFDTPIHWSKSQRDELLQYQHMTESVDRQEVGKAYKLITNTSR